MIPSVSGTDIPVLTSGQYSTVYNLFSLVIASMLFTALFLLLSQGRVAPRYRTALVVSATVCGIATYHYFRIFANFQESYPAGATVGADHVLSNIQFNEAYRYVDWLLTVPLLLVETIAVMALARSASRALLRKLVPASALMILLGYPGEIATDMGARALWGGLSTIPFLYLLYVLFVELSKSVARQPIQVQNSIKRLRISLLALWGVYPIVYLFPIIGGDFFGGPNGFVLRQAGYSIADILAKAAYGLVIYKIARIKSGLEDSQYSEDEIAPEDVVAPVPASGPATLRENAVSRV
ncbi:MAG: bacteriorhodopsin-like [Ornithinibacter sp.]